MLQCQPCDRWLLCSRCATSGGANAKAPCILHAACHHGVQCSCFGVLACQRCAVMQSLISLQSLAARPVICKASACPYVCMACGGLSCIEASCQLLPCPAFSVQVLSWAVAMSQQQLCDVLLVMANMHWLHADAFQLLLDCLLVKQQCPDPADIGIQKAVPLHLLPQQLLNTPVCTGNTSMVAPVKSGLWAP